MTHILNMWLNESPISWSKTRQLLLFPTPNPVPFQFLSYYVRAACAQGWCPHTQEVQSEAAESTWQVLYHLFRLATPCHVSSSLSISTRHSRFGKKAIFYHQLHTFFSCYALDFTIGSLSPDSKQPSWDIISPETNVPTPTLDCLSSQKLPEFFISIIGVIMRKRWGKPGDNICEHS